MTRKDKIQHLLITHLLQEGEIELALPDGLRLELGITRENRHGDLEKCSDYCWLVASQQKRSVMKQAKALPMASLGSAKTRCFGNASRYRSGNAELLATSSSIFTAAVFAACG